ncbi:TetR/AcrR family transcriptional regulator [Actinomadura barringtoniae]|uniref:TetR/AcrR family transcriptional regulator n=1 Tax=Actinomadura barringtoniae TaxID=1427535 RepID=A0A939PGB5_9ACTN|nr:TetR/AcrR family transcriptional regulator [Actinomadura barringtoniae]MBO2451753.1 TetR/AcrR family transcriptional regulator [Actinomadura barringtoniae]
MAQTGRPREFDLDERLDRAMEVFWRHGYDGTALSDLTAAMGINRPSLYAAYGNKEAIFLKALDRYTDGPASYVQTAFEQPTARATAETILRGAVTTTTESGPIGCLFVQGALATSEQGGGIQREMAARRQAAHDRLRERFDRAATEGDLPPDTDTDALARYTWMAAYGLSVQAAGGATADQLHRAVDLTLATWPPPTSSQPPPTSD